MSGVGGGLRERIARALFVHDWENHPGPTTEAMWDALEDFERGWWLARADAVLEELDPLVRFVRTMAEEILAAGGLKDIKN